MIQVESKQQSQPAITPITPGPSARRSVVTVKVYTRHSPSCPRREQPDWARCHCMKWLYVYHNGKDRFVSAKTRSWEKAEQKAREMRDSFDPAKQLERQLEAKLNARNGLVEIALAVEEFLQEVDRLNREEATRAKYKLTLSRLLTWCAAQQPAIILLYQLDVATLRAWILSWGAPPPLATISISGCERSFASAWIRDGPARIRRRRSATSLLIRKLRSRSAGSSTMP